MLQKVDGREEVPAEGHQQVNVVPVALAAEAVSQIVAGVHRLEIGMQKGPTLGMMSPRG